MSICQLDISMVNLGKDQVLVLSSILDYSSVKCSLISIIGITESRQKEIIVKFNGLNLWQVDFEYKFLEYKCHMYLINKKLDINKSFLI